MKANQLLTKCMTCGNNIKCFGVTTEQTQHDLNPADIPVSVDAICKNLIRLDPKNVKEFVVYSIRMYMRSTLCDVDNDAEREKLESIMCVVEGLTGSTETTWACPDDFEYSPRSKTMTIPIILIILTCAFTLGAMIGLTDRKRSNSNV